MSDRLRPKEVYRQLKRLGFKNPIDKNKNYQVVCPFHKDSDHDGGSMFVMKNAAYVKCFSGACGYGADWEQFVRDLGGEWSELATATKDPTGALDALDTFGDLAELEAAEEWEPSLPPGAELWSRGDWRGIREKMLQKVGSLYWYDDYDRCPRIVWPVYFNGELAGWTSRHTDVNPEDPTLKHKHSPGFEHGKHMAFLDYAEKKRWAILVEGVTDGLALVNMNMPGVPIFGTNSWTEIKEAQLLSLDLEFAIIGVDNDPAGKACRERIHDVMGPKLDLFDVVIPKKRHMKKRPDFGNVEEHYPGYLKKLRKIIKRDIRPQFFRD